MTWLFSSTIIFVMVSELMAQISQPDTLYARYTQDPIHLEEDRGQYAKSTSQPISYSRITYSELL